MKKIIRSTLALLLIVSIALCAFSCKPKVEGLWETATYTENKTVGQGEKAITVDIEAEGTVVTLTVKTDKDNLGDALFELGLINDATFFNVLNGIEASWEKHSAYWAFYEGTTMMNCGVGDAEIVGGEHFRFVYTQM